MINFFLFIQCKIMQLVLDMRTLYNLLSWIVNIHKRVYTSAVKFNLNNNLYQMKLFSLYKGSYTM